MSTLRRIIMKTNVDSVTNANNIEGCNAQNIND